MQNRSSMMKSQPEMALGVSTGMHTINPSTNSVLSTDEYGPGGAASASEDNETEEIEDKDEDWKRLKTKMRIRRRRLGRT